ncbi:MAG: FHA domain-containing protein [Chloroflexi bacterium]|nr:MAG: FHA domain-containing protein [Chloroflexota bacterium]
MIIIEYTYLTTSAKRFETADNHVVIGRQSAERPVDLDLTPDVTVSRNHARIFYDKKNYWLEDLGSRGGTWVNNLPISEKTRITLQDRVRIGQTTLRFKMLGSTRRIDSMTDTEPLPIDSLDNLPDHGSFTSSVSATESPTNLLIPEQQGRDTLALVERRLAVFYELGAALGSAQSVEPVLKTVVQHLVKVIPGAQRGAVLLRDGRKLFLKAYQPERSKPSVSLYLAKLAIDKQEAFTWRYDDPGEMKRLTDSIVWHGTKCAMYAPLIWQDEVLGIAYVDNYVAEDAFKKDDLLLLTAMSSQAAMFVKNHTLQEDLRHQEIVRSNLLRQFSPQVADHLEGILSERGQLGLGGERVEPVTILNSDVRGFTAISAQMDPRDVMEQLNQLFSVCIPIIFKYNGTVDKYIGDAILAVFGSPNPDPEGRQWSDAVRAAIEMQRAVRKLGHEWRQLGRPVFEIGIGVHTGAVLQGFIGSHEQMEYTVIGDTVNRTTRYCDGAKAGQIVISPDVFARVRGTVDVRPTVITTKHPETESDLDAFLVKGMGTQGLQPPAEQD